MSKTVTISPPAAAQAGCTATCAEYDTETYTNPNGWMTWYRLTATPAAGWQFVRFEWQIEHQETGQNPSFTSYQRTINPFPPAGQGKDYPGADDAADSEIDYTAPVVTVTDTMVNVVAVFKVAQTDLLVNSSTVESPAQLVYDPETNLLVADY